jgi:hypothetical protein
MRPKVFWTILVTAALTLVGGVLALNFMPSEKQIETRLSRQYDSNDPQFRRSLGVLLGPPILEGNKIEVLLNGDQIFPSMLEAIRSAKKTITFETYIYWSESIGHRVRPLRDNRRQLIKRSGRHHCRHMPRCETANPRLSHLVRGTDPEHAEARGQNRDDALH